MQLARPLYNITTMEWQQNKTTDKSNEIKKEKKEKSVKRILWDLPKMLAPTDEIKWLTRINARAGSMSVILSWHFIMAVESIQSDGESTHRHIQKKGKKENILYKKEPEKIRYLMTE